MEKRKTKDFNIPGRIHFACSKTETDTIMLAIGTKVTEKTKTRLPAGQLLAEICFEWLEGR